MALERVTHRTGCPETNWQNIFQQHLSPLLGASVCKRRTSQTSFSLHDSPSRSGTLLMRNNPWVGRVNLVRELNIGTGRSLVSG